MRQVVAVVLGLGIIALTAPGVVRAADQCPAELTQAKAALKSAQAKSQDIQSPRGHVSLATTDVYLRHKAKSRRVARLRFFTEDGFPEVYVALRSWRATAQGAAPLSRAGAAASRAARWVCV